MVFRRKINIKGPIGDWRSGKMIRNSRLIKLAAFTFLSVLVAVMSCGGGGSERNANDTAPAIVVNDPIDPTDDHDLAFGNVTEMAASSLTITVTNSGTAVLNIGTITEPAAPFSIQTDNCSGQVIPATDSCTVDVQFEPPSPGIYSDSFNIPSDDAVSGTVTVTVRGTGDALVCSAGWSNCDNNAANGCETSISTVQNCGACGINCSSLPFVAATDCVSGICTIQSCAAAWADVDGLSGNGCEFSLNANPSCDTYNSLGIIPGDSGSSVATASESGEAWYAVDISETATNIDAEELTATVQLVSPTDADYDLYAYCLDCSAGVAASSTVLGTGSTDTVGIRKDDVLGSNDQFMVIIEVRYAGGTSSDTWELTVTGNTSVSVATCN